jgi:excisionase family DNA binding protein
MMFDVSKLLKNALRIHPKTLQRMARNGEIAGVQIGRLWRFRASVLNSWLNRTRRK